MALHTGVLCVADRAGGVGLHPQLAVTALPRGIMTGGFHIASQTDMTGLAILSRLMGRLANGKDLLALETRYELNLFIH